MAGFPTAITELLAFLQREGLRPGIPSESPYREDMYVDYSDGALVVRVSKDRGDWDVEIAAKASPGDWYGVSLLGEFFLGEAGRRLTLETAVKFLIERWSDVRRAFGGGLDVNFRASLHELGRQRVRRLYGERGT